MCSYKYSLSHSEILNIENFTPTNTQLYSIHEDDALYKFMISSTNERDRTAQKHMQ